MTINNDSLNQADSAQISFEYLTPGQLLSVLPPDTVLVRDNTSANNLGNGFVTLYADGRVEYVRVRKEIGLAISGPRLPRADPPPSPVASCTTMAHRGIFQTRCLATATFHGGSFLIGPPASQLLVFTVPPRRS